MTNQELLQSLNVILTNYGKDYDTNLYVLWTGLFIKFDANMFKAACLKVIASNKFFPNASEIIDAYQYVKQEAEHERFEKLKENQRLLFDKQAHCYLCDNSGFCFYTVSGYEYVARCVCSHGQDLNKFSESQIKPDHVPEIREYYSDRNKAAIKCGKNPFYKPTVKEVLEDDFAVYDARKKELYLSRGNATDMEKAEILKRIGDFKMASA